MAKRLSDSDIWKDIWFRKLPTKYKMVWIFLCHNCDLSGAWKVDIESLEFYLPGEKFDEAETLSFLNNGKERVVLFDKNQQWMIADFVHFQYGTLTEASSVHRGVLKSLSKHSEKGLPKGYLTIKDMDKDKAMVKNKDKKTLKIEKKYDFEEVWSLYPQKIGRKGAETHFRSTVRVDQDFEDIKQAVAKYAQCRRVKNGYVQNGSTWFNNWRDWVTYAENDIADTDDGDKEILRQLSS